MSATKTLGLIVTFAATAAIAVAQPVPNTGAPSSPAASRLRVTATKPFQMVPINERGRFRMMFRVLATAESEIPTMLIGNFEETLGWLAFTSGGARCNILHRQVKGIGFVPSNTSNLERIVEYLNTTSTSEWNLNKARPTIAIADFDCDRRLAVDEGVTVTTRFYIYNGSAWKAADFTFENIKIGSK